MKKSDSAGRVADQTGLSRSAAGNAVFPADIVDCGEEAGGPDHRIPAFLHLGRPGVCTLDVKDADQRMAVAAAHHHTDRNAPFFHQGILLDMQLEIGIEQASPDRCLAQIAEPPELAQYRMPSSSFRSCSQSTVCSPAKTQEAAIGG